MDELIGEIIKEIQEWHEQNLYESKCTLISLHHFQTFRHFGGQQDFSVKQRDFSM